MLTSLVEHGDSEVPPLWSKITLLECTYVVETLIVRIQQIEKSLISSFEQASQKMQAYEIIQRKGQLHAILILRSLKHPERPKPDGQSAA